MPKRTKLLITLANGIIILGKYTLPKMPAFETKVFDALPKQSEK